MVVVEVDGDVCQGEGRSVAWGGRKTLLPCYSALSCMETTTLISENHTPHTCMKYCKSAWSLSDDNQSAVTSLPAQRISSRGNVLLARSLHLERREVNGDATLLGNVQKVKTCIKFVVATEVVHKKAKINETCELFSTELPRERLRKTSATRRRSGHRSGTNRPNLCRRHRIRNLAMDSAHLSRTTSRRHTDPPMRGNSFLGPSGNVRFLCKEIVSHSSLRDGGAQTRKGPTNTR